MSRVLITGATGFLGRHLVPLLVERGHEVVVLARLDGGPSEGRPNPSSVRSARELEAMGAKRVAWARGDVLDGASVRAAAEGCEALFHLAGKVSRRPEDAEELFRVHVEGTKTTLDAARAAGVKRAVLASTSGVVAVSEKPKPIDEKASAPMDLIQRWPYYRSKLFAERAAFDRSGPGFDVVSVNPTLLLGPGDERESSTGDVRSFLEGKVPFVPAGGISFVDVRDAALAMVLAWERGRAGERYLVAAQNLTLDAFFQRLARISGVAAPRLKTPRSLLLARAGSHLLDRLGKHLPVESIDRASAEMAQCFWYVDDRKARAELGFVSRDPHQTLLDTVEDLRARGVVWPS